MIVLDTNVISELMRAVPEPVVIDWIDTQADVDLFVTAITVAELCYGNARLPDGRRKTNLATHVERMIDEDFDHRVLPFDEAAAAQYGDITASREHGGRPISVADAQIAAICRSHDSTLATRNVDDFADTGITVIDPWSCDAAVAVVAALNARQRVLERFAADAHADLRDADIMSSAWQR